MFLIAVAFGCLEGYVLHHQFEAGQADAVQVWRTRLAEQAAQHARLIESWVAGGLGNARLLASFPAVRDLASWGRHEPGASPRIPDNHASEVIASFVRVHGLRGGYIIGPNGRVLAAAGESPSPSLISKTLERLTAGSTFADILHTPSGPVVVFAAAIEGTRVPTSYVLLVVDPRTSLFAQFLMPPEPTQSGEALLLGLDQLRPVYLKPVYPVSPVSAHGFPTAWGYTQRAGVLQPTAATDYKGEEVVVASRAVPGTSWTLALQMNHSEATRLSGLASLRGAGWVASLALIQIVLVIAVLRRRQARHAREQRESAEQLAFLNRLYRTISEADEMMVREKDRQRLLNETCRIVVAHAGFRMAWIGEARPDGRVEPTAHAGEVHGYLNGIDIRFDETPERRGPMGNAIRGGRTVVVDDVASDEAMRPFRARALAHGYRSCAAVPLVTGDRVLGALKVYAGEPRFLKGEAISLLEKLARNLAYSLDVVDLEARHRETTLALSASEEQLRQAQKMEAIGRLAGGIAHDFNNLLMVISGYAETALSARAEDRRRRSIEEIQSAADRASELTRQLVAFSRKQVLQPKVLNLNDVVLRAQSLLRRLIPENIEIVVRAAPGLPSVMADPSQMEQVLLNLAVNARDAMPSGGRVVIETTSLRLRAPEAVTAAELPPGDYVVMSVTDAGEGMPEEVLEHLFEPFFTTKEIGKGSGLGLSMVYGIVSQSGGAIGVDSAPGRGSSFRVYLPATEAAAPESKQPQTVAAQGRGHESVLVVEDNEQVRSFVTLVLRDAGYRVADAATPGEALAILTTPDGSCDLLLTDIVMPEMDGYDLARQARAARPGLRVLFMSGYSDKPKLREDAAKTGIDLLEKPFGASTLTSKVREVLDRAAPSPASFG